MVHIRYDGAGSEPDPPIESGSDAGASIIAIAVETHKPTGGPWRACHGPPVRLPVAFAIAA